MKLAIHNGKDKEVSWNSRWMDICEEQGIDYIGIDCYSPSIIEDLKKEKVTHLMWAHDLIFPKDLLMARSVLNAAEMMNIAVFPNFNTAWHFEDKLAQKYLLESIDADVVKSWGFFDTASALSFLHKTDYPIVAKLRRGAGSFNVKLLQDYDEASKYVKIMFSKGQNPMPSYTSLGSNRIKNAAKEGFGSLLKKILKAPYKILKSKIKASTFPMEKSYVYFQEFLPNNETDLRIAIVGDRAWGFYRGVRKNDFRASGSGNIIYDKEIPIEVIKKSFDYTQKLNTQSLAFDYVKDQNDVYQIVEICYGYVGDLIYNTHGYWDRSLQFQKGHFQPEKMILEDFIKNKI